MHNVFHSSVSFLLVLILIVSAAGCATTGSSSSGASGSQNGIEVDDPNQTLADYLRQLPGVIVQGSGNNAMVFVRGVTTSSGRNEALFVIDGNRAGSSFRDVVSRIDVNDIDRVRVVKGSEAGSRYGMAGSAGVIEIQTKKN